MPQKEKLYLKVYRRTFKYNFLSIFYRKSTNIESRITIMVFYYLFHTLYHQRQYMHQKVHLFVVYLCVYHRLQSIASINKEITLFRNVYFVAITQLVGKKVSLTFPISIWLADNAYIKLGFSKTVYQVFASGLCRSLLLEIHSQTAVMEGIQIGQQWITRDSYPFT